MDYIQAFKDGHIIVQISTNEEANHLCSLGNNLLQYCGNNYIDFPCVAVKSSNLDVDGFVSQESAMRVLRHSRGGANPFVISYEEFIAGEPEPETQYDDISMIL